MARLIQLNNINEGYRIGSPLFYLWEFELSENHGFINIALSPIFRNFKKALAPKLNMCYNVYVKINKIQASLMQKGRKNVRLGK